MPRALLRVSGVRYHKPVNLSIVDSEENDQPVRSNCVRFVFFVHTNKATDQPTDILAVADNYQPVAVFDPVTELTLRP